MLGIQGIEKVLFTPIPDICTIMVEGDTGVLKSTFVAETIKAGLDKDPGKVCLYLNLKDDIELFKKNMKIQNPYLKEEKIIIESYDNLLDKISPAVFRGNIFKGIVSIIKDYKKCYGKNMAYLVVDPVNILFDNFTVENLRRNLYRFFNNLSDLEIQSWIISEKIEEGLEIEAAAPCHFLSDGIIELGMLETFNDVIRYLEIKKMRGVNHSLKRFQLSYKNNVLKILGCAYE